MIKAVLGLLGGALTAVVLAALDHFLAAAVVAAVTIVVVVTLLVFARRGVRHLVRAARGESDSKPARPTRRSSRTRTSRVQ